MNNIRTIVRTNKFNTVQLFTGRPRTVGDHAVLAIFVLNEFQLAKPK